MTTGRAGAYPTGATYAEALQNTALCFADPELRGGRVALTRLGLPRPISGAFASVFTVTSADGGKFAVKCFTREVPDQADRYREISARLAELDDGGLSQPWKMTFEYLTRGVLVNGHWYPVLKMGWVDGINLSEWLEANHRDALAVHRLAGRFAALSGDLVGAGIAHGDLQHGNLLVAPDGTLRLVDYDGMYVPALAGRKATENGHRNYQSPRRTADDFGPDLDRFSAWLIHTSLVAISREPDLWPTLHEPGGEYLLLTSEDFAAPAASVRFPSLLGHRDPAVRELADRLGRLADLALAAIPEPDPALAAAVPPVPVPAAGPLPGWMNTRGAMPSAPAAPPASVPAARGTSPGLSPLAPQPAAFAGRRTADVVLVLCLLPLLLVLTVVTAVILPLAAPAPAVAAVCAPVYGRARRPEVRSARARLAETRARLLATPDPAAALAEVDREHADADRTEQSRNARVRLQHHQLTQRLQRAHAQIQSDLARDSAAVTRELDDLPQARLRAHANALETVRVDWIRQRLRQHRIGDARLKGIGAVSVGQLEAAGIRTAADFTGAGYPPNTGSGAVDALLVLPDGRMVDIPNIGRQRAEVLVAWRDGIVRRVSPDAPKRVSQADLDAIDRRFEQRRVQLEADLRQRTDAAARGRDDATAQVNAERAQVAEQDRAAKEYARRRTAEFARRAADIRAREPEFRRLTGDAGLWREHLGALSHTRYIRFAVTGG